jgi:hypothetical protein
MAVHSNTFGGVRLSGDDAKKFRDQVRSGKTNAAAKNSALNGIRAARNLFANGQVKVDKTIA